MSRPARTAANLWLAKALWDLGAIQFGDFTLGRTTLHSPIYINLRLLVSKPRALRRAASLMHHEVRTLQSMRHPHVAPFDRVAGIPFGGLHLATAFSLMSNVPMVYVHPSKDREAAKPFVEGIHQRGETVLLLDDLVTGGGNVIETAAFLGMAGLKVKDVVVLLDRQEGAKQRLKANGYNLISILELETMLNYLMASGKIEEDWYRKSINYVTSRRPR
ncbi:MAG: phosphoribosyltransferase family protein [Chloroflexota bacterium]|nr:phosphoribosyltransferase family protein [Chloroflexota bacterium]